MQRIYAVTLNGESPLLMHSDNIEHAELTQKWARDPMHKKESVAGDDRSPAWTWLGYLYHDKKRLVVDSDNIMAMLRDAGRKCPAQKGRGSMMAATQSGILCNELGWPLLVNGAEIPYQGLNALHQEPDFDKHVEVVNAMGFTLFMKRAGVNGKKHVRVRPRFETWSASGTITVFDDQITDEVLMNILTMGGVYVGLGDWRPGSPKKPGQFGRFSVDLKPVKK